MTGLQFSGERLLIRADASVAIGTGHVMRCLALSQAWQDQGGSVTFAMAQSTTAIEERLRTEGVRLIRMEVAPGSAADSAQLIKVSLSQSAAWVVVDGYVFDSHYQEALGAAGLKVILIDDNGRLDTYTVKIVLNQNIHAHESLYKNREAYTRLLLGTKYALLRREFVSANFRREFPAVGRKALVSMGGSDPYNVTLSVLEAIEAVGVEKLQVIVVAGGSNPHLASVREAVAKSSQDCRVLTNVNNMQEVIAWADFAISAAGTTCWEYCALGLPAILIAVAENQVVCARALHDTGAARLVGGGAKFAVAELAQAAVRLAHSSRERRTLSQNARALVDGQGAARTVSVLLAEGAS
ncbi:MAG: UDP-2,4-diacetamido-2,4,6-trideoxy-beta-L-altropyranose hydrolase [Terriglobales bacterium]